MILKHPILTKLFFCIFLLFLQTPALFSKDAPSPQPFDLSSLKQDLLQILKTYTMNKPGEPFTDNKIPGASASIRYLKRNEPGDGVHFNLVNGYSNPHVQSSDCPTCPIPLQEDMIFEIGSSTKALTAACILLYMQEGVELNGGALTLDSVLYQYLPAITNDRINGSATTRQIMNMTAGIPEFQLGTHGDAPSTQPIVETGSPKAPTSPARFWTQENVYAVVGYPTTVPGQKWSYCNTNYVILGQYLQGLNNYVNIAGVYNAKLFDPYGLDNIYMAAFEPIPANETWAIGWTGSGDNSLETSRTAFYSAYWSAGAMIGRAEDLAHFALLMWSPDQSIIKKPLYDEMMKMVPFQNAYAPVDGIQWNGYGLGTMRVTVESPQYGTVELFGHNGQTGGYLTASFYLHKREVAFSVIFNGGGSLSNKTMVELERDFTYALLKYARP